VNSVRKSNVNSLIVEGPVLARILGLVVVELLISAGILWVALHFGAEFPIPLLFLYALFRTFEYYSLKHLQALSEWPGPSQRKGIAVISVVLMLARIAGWGMLILLAYRAGILNAVALVAVAFPLSLAFQTIYEYTIRPMQTLGALLTLIALPLTVIAIIFEIKSI
jgi:hypothetical protein